MRRKSKTPVADQVPTSPIRCEDCRNFTGLPYLFQFGCAKGHEPDDRYFMTRVQCPDHAPLSREEVIFKRFKITAWSRGDAQLKNKKASVRRTATSLRSAISEFEKVLTSDQISAIQAAALSFDRLGDDIELAARLAKKFKEDEDARFARERQAKLDLIAAHYFGIAGSAKVLEIAEDLSVFFSGRGIDWFRRHRNDKHALFYSSENIGEAIGAYRAAPSQKLLDGLKTTCARCFERMGMDGDYHPSSDPTVPEFEAFRVWLSGQKELERIIAADDKIVQLPTPRRR